MISSNCAPLLTGANISLSCSEVKVNPTVIFSADGSLSTSASVVTGSAEASSSLEEVGFYVGVSFTVDETWLITGGTGQAEFDYIGNNGLGTVTPLPFLSLSAMGGENAEASAGGGMEVTVNSIDGIRAQDISFTFGVPFSFVEQVSAGAGANGNAEISYELGTQTYMIPNANLDVSCGVGCLLYQDYWQIVQAGSDFQWATLTETASDPDIPEPSFAAPLALILLIFARWRRVGQPLQLN